MNKMTYKGYAAHIEYDDEDRIFVGHLLGINDIVGFHADTVVKLEQAFTEAVDDYLAISEQTGRSAQKPYSGNLMLRVDPQIHAAVAVAAKTQGQSINQWAANALHNAAH